MVGTPQDRTGPAMTLIEGFGRKLHSYFFVFGEYDGLAICEFPDNTAAAACSMTAASTGAFSRFETMSLLTAKEAQAAMQRAHDTKTGYVPPLGEAAGLRCTRVNSITANLVASSCDGMTYPGLMNALHHPYACLRGDIETWRA
jgi:uncharacterized protein with GYD domain